MVYRVPSMEAINAFAGKNGLTCISTFSGGGGSSIGYKAAGYDVRVACEFMPDAAQTYRNNAPHTQVVEKDVRQITGQELMDAAGVKRGELDLFDGSPPCSAFSFSGKRERGWGQEKNYSGSVNQRVDDLFMEFIRLVDEINPKVFVAENVIGMAYGQAAGYMKEVFNLLQKTGDGYDVMVAQVEADQLGVPQIRKRLIYIGVRKDLGKKPVFPKPFGFQISCQQAISDLPEPYPALDKYNDTPSSEREYHLLQEGTRTLFAWENTNIMHDKGCFRDTYIKLFGKKARYNWFRCPPNVPSPTITAKIPSLFRWDIPRTFSIPEIKRLSSFPDDYKAGETFNQSWERIGRAVPPMMMGAIANTIAKQVFGVQIKTLVDEFHEGLTK